MPLLNYEDPIVVLIEGSNLGDCLQLALQAAELFEKLSQTAKVVTVKQFTFSPHDAKLRAVIIPLREDEPIPDDQVDRQSVAAHPSREDSL